MPFHLLLAVPIVALLIGFSGPGVPAITLLAAVPAVFVLGIVWLLRLGVSITEEDRASGWWWIVAPMMVVSAAYLIATDVPLKARFGLGRADFDALLTDLEPHGSVNDWAWLDVPGRIGSFEVTSAYQVGERIILYDAGGSGFLDDAGFAYLPDGPDHELSTETFENPTFRSLGGGWYAWIASW